jgi:hypothetical protein
MAPMDRQARINVFSLAAHRLAVSRLREQPARLDEALGVLRRWRQQAGGPSHCDPYWNEWERLLQAGPDAVEQAVCTASDHAATLLSVSPLGRFISVAERSGLLRQAREAA